MSTRIEIKAGETGTVRVFSTDLSKEDIDGFDMVTALGAESLSPDQVELFDLADLTGLGLSAYLEEGHGIPADQLADMKPQIDGLTGVVLILPSRALAGKKQTLRPQAPLRLLGTFFESTQPISFEKLPSEAAKGQVNTQTKSPPSNAAISGRVAMVALLFLALLVAVMIWIAA